MKALSIRPDYALAIMMGLKTEEYRTWQTRYRGDLLICDTARKIKHTVPGYALCVTKIIDIEKVESNQGTYYAWQLAPFKQGGSYWIEPIPVKGRQHLFNVDNSLIKPAPFSSPFDPVTGELSDTADEWFNRTVTPLACL